MVPQLFPTTKVGGGVTIALHKDLPFIPTDTLTDTEGRYVFLKGTLFGRPLTLASLYAPNSGQLTFLESTLDSLATFREGQLILGGDLNFCADPRTDTSSGRLAHTFAAHHRFRRLLQAHGLVDGWRLLHPSIRDYSYYSATHDSYTRIDMLPIDQSRLESLAGAEISTRTLSDHAPVGVRMNFLHQGRGNGRGA